MKRVTNILTLLGVIAFFVIIGLRGHFVAYLIGMALPIIAIIYGKMSNGAVHFFDRKNGPPSVFLPIILPAAGLGFATFGEFDVFDIKKSLLYATIVSLVIIVFILVGNKEVKLNQIRTYLLTLVLWIMLWFYSYGLVVVTNSFDDNSAGQTFITKVVDKEKRKAKLMNYYLVIGPWHTRTHPRETKVEEPFYNLFNINDDIKITLRTGRLGIGWYEMSK